MADQQPIIVKKIKKSAEGHHGGSWKVAFADFMTAMMAFFLVMWILGLDQETRSLIAGYFKDPYNFQKEAKGNTMASLLKQNEGKGGTEKAGAPNEGYKAKKQDQDVEEMSKIGEEITKTLEGIPDLKDLRQMVEINLSEEGLMISILDGAGSVFFETGSATVRPKAVELFQKLGQILQKAHHKVVIDGHTDAKPYSLGAKYNNWDLSQDRAQSTLDVMRSGGFSDENVLAVRGFAATRLRYPKDPFHFSNRRVTILLPYKWMEDKVLGMSSVPQVPIQAEIKPTFGLEHEPTKR